MEALTEQKINNFLASRLEESGFKLVAITKSLLEERIDDIMDFVNGILMEYQDVYPMWAPKPKEWFTNPLDRKFKYSYMILDSRDRIAFFNFSSVYGDLLHNHCSYTGKEFRGMGLAKLHMMKVAMQALQDGFSKYEGYWDKHNNGSLILHLKMGFKIEDMRKQEQLYLLGDLKEVLQNTYQLYNRKSQAKEKAKEK